MGFGRPRAFNTAEELRSQLEAYFNEEAKPTMAGVCVHLSITKETWSAYGKGNYDDENNNFSDLVKKARELVESVVEARMLFDNGGAGTIFWLKNHGGYKDRTEIEHDASPEMQTIAERMINARKRTQQD